jgi:camphor 5-monooxygenase
MTELAAPPETIAPERIVDFDIYAPPGVKNGLHESWKMLHAPGLPDIVWTPHNGGHWIATRSRVINMMLADYRRFSSRTIFVPKETVGAAYRGALPGTIDPPEHRPFRSLLNERLSPAIVAGMEPDVRRHAAELAEQVRADGVCNFVTAFSEVLPIRVLMTLMHLPMKDVPMLRSWADLMVRPTGDLDFAKGKQNYIDYLAPVVDARTGKPGNDLISHLINTPMENRTLTRDEALNFCFLVLFGGLDTVVQFLSFAMLHLARDAENRRALVADPGLIPKAVEELLRRFPVVNIAREVTQNTTFEGAELLEGDMIVAALPLAGIDDRPNACPMTVDFNRKRMEHATFGGGAHRCPGNHLARLEIRVMIEEWLLRIPEFEVAPGAKIEFTSGITASVNTMPLVWDKATTIARPLA